MAEPPAAAAPQAAAPEGDALLATKLHLPGPRPGLVPRPRLAGQLEAGLGQGMVLVCAPAGYGKTVLLADWALASPRPVAWLSLDPGDNDPARFWRHAVAALDRVRPGIGARVGPLIGPPTPASFEGLLTALINDLGARPAADEALLVLDDYHVIGARPVHDSVQFLLEHRPPGLRLVLTSRSDPPLALARLRARGQLAELRAADLRFTAAEAGALLRQMAGGPGAALPGTAVAALAARTEGWAAGLQLAALSLRGQADAAAFVAAFTGSHRYVLDYLGEEVLECQPEQLQTFLLETSVLERLSGGLCDAVTGRAGSQALLEQVEQAGLFLLPLDDVRGWWRYHRLFADLLRTRLQQEPDRAARLHRNAAAWHEQHGLADEAIRHAVAAGEMTWAARLIERYFDAVYRLRGEPATIQRWISALPAGLLQSRPRLLLAQAQLAAAASRMEAVQRFADAAERAFAAAADEPFEPSVGRASSLLANIPAHIALCRGFAAQYRGDAEATAAFASRARAELGEGDRLLDYETHCDLAVAEWLRGRLAAAEQALVPSIAGWADRPIFVAWGRHLLGRVQRARGRLDAAVQTYQQAQEATAGPGRAPLPAAGIGYVGLAEVARQRGELDAALEQVTEGIELCRQLAYVLPLAAGLVTLAWIRQARGDQAGALDAMREAARTSQAQAGPLNPVPAQQASLLLAQGDLPAAARWIAERGLQADDEPDYAREPGHLVLARLLLAQGQPGRALSLLDRLHIAAVAQERTGSIIETGALRALALAASGRESEAVTVLAGMLTLAGQQGHVRVFADEGPPMAALLGRLIAAQRADQTATRVPLGFLARLQRAFGSACPVPGTRPARAAVPGLIDPLTGRELEVLRLVAAGRSNQDIAQELVVTLDTVKKHVSHILSKLGGSNRTEAVTRARQLDLIS
jgi:LuxR family maltose regulon positive regulatory protein